MAVKAINALDKAIKKRIKVGIEGLTEVPPKGDIKQMEGFNPPLYRLRIGKYLYYMSILILMMSKFSLLKI